VLSPLTACIQTGTNSQNILTMKVPFSGTTNWTYPTASGHSGAIKQANVNTCAELDASDNDWVKGAPCNGSTAEMWINIYDPQTKHTQFESVWALEAQKKLLCLTFPSNAVVAADPCNPTVSGNADQQWWS
jgi:hypothetical protein